MYKGKMKERNTPMLRSAVLNSWHIYYLLLSQGNVTTVQKAKIN